MSISARHAMATHRTSTDGSVRAPASHCGLIGLRPTHERVSLQGAMDLAPDFDTCGWFVRDIGSFGRAGAVLLGQDSCALPDAPEVMVAADVLNQDNADVLVIERHAAAIDCDVVAIAGRVIVTLPPIPVR